jgi:hypothetical protein
MLLRNLNNNLINGSRGVIVRFKVITDEEKGTLMEKGITSEWIAKNRVNIMYAFPIKIFSSIFQLCAFQVSKSQSLYILSSLVQNQEEMEPQSVLKVIEMKNSIYTVHSTT